ncbi:MAG: DUF1573 domain-containing protein [Candidatus Aminicenantes bacterium]|nr:DUF1573 domain-containing protein [Candidatus Aminicenantes bacterium]
MTPRTLRRLAAPLAILAVLALAAPAQAKKPRAVFKAMSHDFGKVKQGDVVSHEFTFRNEGDAPLVVERIETTCGCTAALVSEKSIGPYKEGKIKATFDTRGYSGRMTRFLYVVSNDAVNPRGELSLSVDIEVPPSARIDIDRYNLDMGLVLEGESPAAKIVVKSAGERELKVEVAHESVKFFSGGKPLASAFSLPVGESREIEIRFPPQARPGVQRDYILVKSNDPVRTTLSIYVSRYVITRKELQELFDKYQKVLKDK